VRLEDFIHEIEEAGEVAVSLPVLETARQVDLWCEANPTMSISSFHKGRELLCDHIKCYEKYFVEEATLVWGAMYLIHLYSLLANGSFVPLPPSDSAPIPLIPRFGAVFTY
jgi:hypothetical protein